MKHLTAFNIKEYLANTPQITFEVTEACNLACVYCGYGSLYNDKDPRSNRKLCAIDAISFLMYMKTLWNEGYRGTESNVLHISFYGGEPLLNMPLIKKIVDYSERELRKYKKVIIYSLTTNALLLPINIEYLVSKEFRILISLDGNREGNKYRIYQDGRPAYDKILESIDFVRNNYPTYFQNNVEFNSVLNNFNSVKTLRSYFIQNYNKTPSIGEINTSGIHPKQTDFFKKIYKSKIESEEEAALDSNSTYYQDSPDYPRIARYLQTHSPFFYSDYNELLLGKNKQEKLPTGTCLPFSKKVFITVTGKIFPCERISHKYFLGSLHGGEVHLDFDEIANKYNSYYEKVYRVCQRCKEYHSCLCCMFYNGQLERKNAFCSFYVSENDAKENLISVYRFLKKYPEAYCEIMKNFKVV